MVIDIPKISLRHCFLALTLAAIFFAIVRQTVQFDGWAVLAYFFGVSLFLLLLAISCGLSRTWRVIIAPLGATAFTFVLSYLIHSNASNQRMNPPIEAFPYLFYVFVGFVVSIEVMLQLAYTYLKMEETGVSRKRRVASLKQQREMVSK